MPIQPSATSPLLLDNLHFEHLDKSVNHKSTLKYLSKCSKWRLSKKSGLVADGCIIIILLSCEFDGHVSDITMWHRRHAGPCEFDIVANEVAVL